MVTMKMLYNNKGISLVVLIVAMTLIALLGASFVSLMGSKQKGFLYQIDSYRALNLANAGVEYTIRYIGNSIYPNVVILNDFFHNASGYNIPVRDTIPDLTNLNDAAQWRRINFGGGQFYVSYYLNTSDPDNFAENKMLYSVGVMKETKRVVKLRKFLAYASPTSTGLGRLNLVPNHRPYISTNYVVVPVMHLYDADTTTPIAISSIQFKGDFANNLTKELRDIRFNNTNSPPLTPPIYSYSSYLYPGSPCPHSPAWPAELPCRQSDHIEIPDNGPITQPLTLTGVTMPSYSIRWFFFRFSESENLLNGSYSITFNTQDDSVNDSSTITFSVP
jgi:hypothetical protein